MTALNIIKSLTKRGNTVIGAGCYAVALESTVSNDIVIKIGNNSDDPWLDYYSLVITKYSDALCVPKIHSFYHDTSNCFYVCNMEKLYYYTDEATKTAKKLVKDYVSGSIDEAEWFDAAVEYPKHFGHLGQFMAIMDVIKQESDYDYEDWQYEDGTYRRVDLHEANILSRANGQLVITDPWCDHEDAMNDIMDVSNWAEDNLRFAQ